MSHTYFSNRIAISFLSLALAACGGGGSNGSLTSASVAGQFDTAGQSSTSTNGNATSPTGAATSGSSSTGTSAAGSTSSASPSAGSPSASAGQVTQADATQARFRGPIGIAVDAAGTLYVADSLNYTVRKITTTGVVTTLAGSAGVSGAVDGAGPAARFTALKGIAVDSAGNTYVVDGNAIRKITPTGVVTTLAGAVIATGDADANGTLARFNQPYGIAIDGAGNLYVADTQNYLIRKVTPVGDVSTVAGARGMRGTADGVKGAATFLGPRGIASDTAGNLYVTDWYGPPAPNLRQGSTFVRTISATGEVATVAGTYSGETGPAQFADAFAITTDGNGNAYVATGRKISKISNTGAVSVYATSSTQFDALEGIAINGSGTLFVTDTFAVSKVAPGGAISLVAGSMTEGGCVDTP